MGYKPASAIKATGRLQPRREEYTSRLRGRDAGAFLIVPRGAVSFYRQARSAGIFD